MKPTEEASLDKATTDQEKGTGGAPAGAPSGSRVEISLKIKFLPCQKPFGFSKEGPRLSLDYGRTEQQLKVLVAAMKKNESNLPEVWCN